MRDAFVKTLTELARRDRSVMLLTGDLGFGVLTKFSEEFPEQYLNMGVAEQNMTGVAAGLALEGKKIFTYSIGNFCTLRCLEQIRNDVCYHNADVKIVSIGGGFCYGPLGISHHATEDLAIMRALPNLTVVAPGDLTETEIATKMVYEHKGPCYLRLGRGGEARVHEKVPDFTFGKAIRVVPEGDVALISTGGILSNVIKAAKLLKESGVVASMTSMPFIVPFDHETVAGLAKNSKLIATVEEHTISGGLGGAVAEVLAEMRGPKCDLIRLGVKEGFTSVVGDQNYLRDIYGLSPDAIASAVKSATE